MTAARPQLEYAPPPGRRRWRWWRRRLIVALLLLVVALAVRQFGPGVGRRAELLYWQRRCMAYAAPADRVVFALGASGPELRTRAGYEPAGFCWNQPLGAQFVPEPWRQFSRTLAVTSNDAPATGAVLFMHERYTPHGVRCLVVIGCRAEELPFLDLPHHLDVFHFQTDLPLRALTRNPRASEEPRSDIDNPNGAAQFFQIFAGQADPNDPSRFTIAYELDGRPGMIYGHVVDGFFSDRTATRVDLSLQPFAPDEAE